MHAQRSSGHQHQRPCVVPLMRCEIAHTWVATFCPGMGAGKGSRPLARLLNPAGELMRPTRPSGKNAPCHADNQ